jgi:hypothetical protein
MTILLAQYDELNQLKMFQRHKIGPSASGKALRYCLQSRRADASGITLSKCPNHRTKGGRKPVRFGLRACDKSSEGRWKW